MFWLEFFFFFYSGEQVYTIIYIEIKSVEYVEQYE